MVASGCKLLLGAVVVACAATSGAGAQGVPCVPGLPIPGCEAPPSSGPPGPGGEPQPPPKPPPGPAAPCSVRRARGSGAFTGVVAEQIYGSESNYRGCALSALADAGVRVIRQPLRWREIERARGVYDYSWWDRYMEALASHRIRVLPILFEPPDFRSAKGSTRGIYPPRRNSEMAAFAARVARRYGPGGSFWKAHPRLPAVPIRSWQIWNEPNLVFYWPPKPNARAYTKLLATVGRAIKGVDNKAEIVTAGFPQSKLRGAVPQRSYLRALYRAGAKKHFDTLAVHSYTESHRDLVDQLTGIRAEMRRHHDRAKIWITEIGWATGGPDKKYTPGAAGQARRIDQTFRLVKQKRRSLGMRGIVYFMWQDAEPYPGFKDFWGLHTGLLDIDGHEKPGMKPFRRHALGLN
jgi:hypothetical protein